MTEALVDLDEAFYKVHPSVPQVEGKHSNMVNKIISPDLRDDQCYNCSGFCHYSRDCPWKTPRKVKCFNCVELGRIQHRCPLPRRNKI